MEPNIPITDDITATAASCVFNAEKGTIVLMLHAPGHRTELLILSRSGRLSTGAYASLLQADGLNSDRSRQLVIPHRR
jgi:hypothetical protein